MQTEDYLKIPVEDIHSSTIEYDYPAMQCFWCSRIGDTVVLKEHEAARWLSKDQLADVEWLPADIALITDIATALESPAAGQNA